MLTHGPLMSKGMHMDSHTLKNINEISCNTRSKAKTEDICART